MRRRIIPYNSSLKPLARNLRNNSTLAEILLWQQIKNKQLGGYDFHRQKPLGNYIVDFFCNELMLAIEIDGSSHNDDEVALRDVIRQQEIEAMGVRVIRFEDREVKRSVEEIVETIELWIEENQ